MICSILGSNMVTRKANIQFDEKAIDEHSLLASGEKISALRVHAKGPKPIENATIKIIKLVTGRVDVHFAPGQLAPGHFAPRFWPKRANWANFWLKRANSGLNG